MASDTIPQFSSTLVIESNEVELVKSILKWIYDDRRELAATYGTSQSRNLTATCSGAVVEVLRSET